MTEPGSVIDGKYKILKEAGRGGMSAVYLAEDNRLNKYWAVKEISIEAARGSAADWPYITSLLSEAYLLKRLDHPAFPRIVDLVRADEKLYIVMDYIDGISLDRYVQKYGPLSERAVSRIGRQLCDALIYLHSQNPPLIYRDMKPSNIMLCPGGNVKLIDFGITSEYGSCLPAGPAALGTKGYAPPEQYSGRCDARSDIYSLGMTLYYLLTGASPKPAKTRLAPGRIRPPLSKNIVRIINTCISPSPEDRYQSCRALLSDLEDPALLKDTAADARRKKKSRKLKRVPVLIAAMLIFPVFYAISGPVNTHIAEHTYQECISSSDPEKIFSAIKIHPDRPEAYNALIDHYRIHGASDEDIARISSAIDAGSDRLDPSGSETAEMYYKMGKLAFSEYSGSLKQKAINAQDFFKTAAASESGFDGRSVAQCYYSICSFLTSQTTTSEHSSSDFQKIFGELENTLSAVESLSGSEANYDKISFYYTAILFINTEAPGMASAGFDRGAALDMLRRLYENSVEISSSLAYVNTLRDKIITDYAAFVSNVNMYYDEAEKRHQINF